MEICRRLEFHVVDGKLPKACYTLDKNGRNELCIWVQNLRGVYSISTFNDFYRLFLSDRLSWILMDFDGFIQSS